MDTLIFTQHNIFMLLQQMSVFLVIAYLFTKTPVFRTFSVGDLRPRQMLVLYAVFSSFSIMGTYFGFPINDAIANTRAIGAVLSGIIGGPVLGTAVGLTSGIHRMTLGGFTAVSCGISTTLEGLIGGLFHLYLIKKNRQAKLLSPKVAFFATFIAEVVQMIIILLTAKPFDDALALVQVIYIPMILANSVGAAIFVSIIRDQKSMYDRLGVIFSNKALRIADKTLSILRNGFNEKTAEELVDVIHLETGVGAVGITDRKKVLAFKGLGDDHHTVGLEFLSPEPVQAIKEDRVIYVDGAKKQWECKLSPDCPLGSVLSIPLRFEGQVIGTINLFEPKDKLFLVINKTLGEGITNLLSNQLLHARYTEQKSLLMKAELKLVQAQINPHFLFNALNTVIAILRKDSGRARELLLSLSTFFRKNLKREGDTATLEDELNHVNSYLVIEKARFEDRLTLNMDIDPDLLYIRMPVFTLQPLIENAIKHGISNMVEHGVIKLTVRREDGMIKIEIEDNAGNCSEWDRSGLGMQIVEKRIKNLCGEMYGLEVTCKPYERTLVTVKLPEKGCLNDTRIGHR
ncbi:sensor histidine kinase [Maridesulfovibrio hydrothermalis]|uniref:histidine kinase n=1 Tax=Maridesulfovibrio hydrothermalis AM13 = DSM 14728 TaxID=1121451 RepID=L0RCE0_9BACT|nr:sensor histidine kinase [Maridesulfovibrio hydrothermalis]CCO24428.1 sensory kinase in two-component system with YehT [Maridesulfovibrio hydrothermalis AM13 = DSM 14728]